MGNGKYAIPTTEGKDGYMRKQKAVIKELTNVSDIESALEGGQEKG